MAPGASGLALCDSGTGCLLRSSFSFLVHLGLLFCSLVLCLLPVDASFYPSSDANVLNDTLDTVSGCWLVFYIEVDPKQDETLTHVFATMVLERDGIEEKDNIQTLGVLRPRRFTDGTAIQIHEH
ncbi:hypothetical protein EDC01DRAFT_666310 [Geopyxis carbonaria]|nr:hypothetical protein EDC01DRAFT_666310 [Geopyxis carbonaria]